MGAMLAGGAGCTCNTFRGWVEVVDVECPRHGDPAEQLPADGMVVCGGCGHRPYLHGPTREACRVDRCTCLAYQTPADDQEDHQ